MIVEIESTSRLPLGAYRRTDRRKRRWWLRREGGGFVDIGDIQGFNYARVVVDLAPGNYVLGVGDRKHGIRERFTV